MKNILLIEIKDNKTIATLTKIINGKNNLLLHKTYNSKPLSTNGVLYDTTIVDNLKKDLNKIIDINNIYETYLTINTCKTFISTKDFEIKFNSDQEESINNYKKLLKIKNQNLHLVKLTHSESEAVLTKKTIKITSEFVEKEFTKEILSNYKAKGFSIKKLIPVSEAITKSLKNNIPKNQSAFNVIVEDGFTLVNSYYNGALHFTEKWQFGLNDIYEYIANMMEINVTTAKEYFNKFGSIPPEDVVDDKVIHTFDTDKGIQIFTKKDLSRMITEKVNILFANVKKEYTESKISIDKMTFSGEIKSLTGFKKYASKSFAEENIKNISSSQIGLKEATEFITEGLLTIAIGMIPKNDEKQQIFTINKKSLNLLNKISRMYNYI